VCLVNSCIVKFLFGKYLKKKKKKRRRRRESRTFQ